MDELIANRQRLKEIHRAKLRKTSGVDTEKVVANPKDNYGRAFGPLVFSFSERLIHETKNAVREKLPQVKSNGAEIVSGTTDKGGKMGSIKLSRDYSFLNSDESDIPILDKKLDVKKLDSGNTKSGDNKVALNVGPVSSWNPTKDKEVFSSTAKPCDAKKLNGIKRKGGVEDLKKKSNKQKICEKKNSRDEYAKDEFEEAIKEIRRMTKYDPTKYRDDKDDIRTVASYRDIEKEERRSAKLGRKEDDEELQKIIQEEKNDRMKKMVKQQRS